MAQTYTPVDLNLGNGSSLAEIMQRFGSTPASPGPAPMLGMMNPGLNFATAPGVQQAGGQELYQQYLSGLNPQGIPGQGTPQAASLNMMGPRPVNNGFNWGNFLGQYGGLPSQTPQEGAGDPYAPNMYQYTPPTPAPVQQAPMGSGRGGPGGNPWLYMTGQTAGANTPLGFGLANGGSGMGIPTGGPWRGGFFDPTWGQGGGE